MFHPDPATADLIFTALTCAGGISMGLLGLITLPWTDTEIEQVDRSARRLAAQVQDRVAMLGSPHSQVTSFPR